MTTDDGGKKGAVAGAIDRDIQGRLGSKLKDAYGGVLNEPVPDRFVDLLDKLADSEASKSGKQPDATGSDNGDQ